MKLGLVLSFLLMFSTSALASETFTFDQLCFEKAEGTVLKSFEDDWGHALEDPYTDVVLESIGSDHIYYEISATSYVPGPYDGSKTSIYGITIKYAKETCTLSEPELLEDFDIDD